MYKKVLKRFFDFIVASIAVIILSPILIVLIGLLFLSNRGAGVFFFQDRPGVDRKIFKVIKFKTMNDQKDSEGNLLPDVHRITKIGKIIRATSLDELPQLFNVLKGDMSLVGPRPLLVKYLPLYNEFQNRRHEVRPGITGWAQVNGRNSINWDQKFALDIYYVDNISLRLDLLILIKTVQKVFKRSGINSSNDNTMETFKGNF